MSKSPIVGSLSPQRLQAMLEIAAPTHPQLDFEIKTLGTPAGLMPPLPVGTQFKGERPTARSGEAWNAQTVARALGEVSREVASSKAGEDDLVSVRNLEPSLAQAVLTEVALEKGWAVETADGRVEWVQFGKIDAGWIEAILERIKAVFTGRADRPDLPDTPDPLSNKCRLVVVGDWGTGLYGAPRFTRWAKANQDWEAIVHLGDTYYAGTKREVRNRLEECWPEVPSSTAKTLSRFLNGNHEMYSGGRPYFNFIKGFAQALPQKSSCFAMQNDDWLIVGLDTSWYGFEVEPAMQSGHLDAEQIAWLTKLVASCGSRKVILMSHHQPFHFTNTSVTPASELITDLQFLWETKKVTHWFWGHEHFGVRYAPSVYGFEGRCLGHGGMPEGRLDPAKWTHKPKPIPGTACSWQGLTPTVGGQAMDAWVLDGPNPLITEDPDAFSPHGWAVVRLDGQTLAEDWYLADGEVLITLLP